MTDKTNNKTYAVGDLFTTQKSGITGVIKEINPISPSVTKVLLDVDGSDRWTTAVFN